jgi:O-antigen/teichoic acid export membrane protein
VLLAGMAVMAGYSQLPSTRPLAIPFLVFIATGASAAATFQAANLLALLVAFGEQVISTILQSLWGLMVLFILWTVFRLGWGTWAFPTSIGFGALLTVFFVRIALIRTGHSTPVFVWHAGADFRSRLETTWRPALAGLHNQVATAVIFTADLIIVGLMVGPGDAAIYGLVTRVAALSRQVLQSIAEAAWPRLTQESDADRKAVLMRKVDRLNAWSVGAWYGAMAATLLPFLTSLVKPDWIASPLLADLIIVRSFIISLAGPHSYGLISAGKFKELAWLSQKEAIIGVVLGVILSYTNGVVGTAAAYLIASCSMSAWQMTREYFRSAHDTHWAAELFAIWWRGLVGIAAGLAIARTLWNIEQLCFPAPGWASILAGGVGYVVPMALVLLLWRVLKRVP